MCTGGSGVAGVGLGRPDNDMQLCCLVGVKLWVGTSVGLFKREWTSSVVVLGWSLFLAMRGMWWGVVVRPSAISASKMEDPKLVTCL